MSPVAASTTGCQRVAARLCTATAGVWTATTGKPNERVMAGGRELVQSVYYPSWFRQNDVALEFRFFTVIADIGAWSQYLANDDPCSCR
jgi:hypothetical protein